MGNVMHGMSSDALPSRPVSKFVFPAQRCYCTSSPPFLCPLASTASPGQSTACCQCQLASARCKLLCKANHAGRPVLPVGVYDVASELRTHVNRTGRSRTAVVWLRCKRVCGRVRHRRISPNHHSYTHGRSDIFSRRMFPPIGNVLL